MLEKLKTQLRRLGRTTMYEILTPNNIAIAIAIVLCVYWGIGAMSSMAHNWELQEKLRTNQLARNKLELEVQTLELEQEYYLTDEYQEIMARTKSGKMLPGETMVILPNNSEKAINKYQEIESEPLFFQSNFSQWLDFLFG